MASSTRALFHWREPTPAASTRLQLHQGHRFSTSTTFSHKETSTDYEEFYSYTSGRWLWNEAARLQERYKKLNVPELQRLAAKSCGAQYCLEITKLAEGGFNKVFKLTIDDRRTVIARIPNPNVAHTFRVTASEVATMEFTGKDSTRHSCADSLFLERTREDNPVGTAYILMEHASGNNFDLTWQDMDIDDKFTIVERHSRHPKAVLICFLRKRYHSHGSLYFAADSFAGCVKPDTTGDFTSAARQHVEAHFVVGPVAESAFYEPSRDSNGVDRGPWSDAQKYFDAVAKRERNQVVINSQSPFNKTQTSCQDTLSLLDNFETMSSHILPKETRLSRPTLWHWDLRLPNIFAKNGRITSVIDWQDTWIGPMSLLAKRPQFIDYYDEQILRLPDHYETTEDPVEQRRVTDKVEESVVLRFYNEATMTQHSEPDELFDLPLARKRKETVSFLSKIADGGNAQLRECLLHLKRRWYQLETGIECPIHSTQNPWMASWPRDGWTLAENYEEALQLVKDLRKQGLSHLTSAELDECEKQSCWLDEVGGDK